MEREGNPIAERGDVPGRYLHLDFIPITFVLPAGRQVWTVKTYTIRYKYNLSIVALYDKVGKAGSEKPFSPLNNLVIARTKEGWPKGPRQTNF